ncbi:serine hydrolase [Dermatobacter hominis]|uniref:serine hydrolase n=1 Tax=Dermatobacter hominis TaxID=2884263 RepID=UPI001D1096B9|nr:serine hydrolase [Dermatobacter hominis]UDY37979.1 serine hydrolase [Dermatobacter hominis]
MRRTDDTSTRGPFGAPTAAGDPGDGMSAASPDDCPTAGAITGPAGAASAARPSGRDRFLDVVRALALVRVILWHTWSAAWLTWFPAMPAMFFGAGALLDGSLERRGWWATVRQRARRLLIPFWVYGAVSVAVMVAMGWRPGPGELFGWLVPVVDPVGSDELRGLWIPLWYVRAYVWFVLGAAGIRWLVRRVGVGAPVLFAVATVAVYWAEQVAGRSLLPLSVLDAVSYGTFVAAGMVYAQRDRRVPAARTSAVLGLALAVAAVLAAMRYGPADLVVNRSALLTVLVGGVGLMVLFALHPILASVDGVTGRGVDALVRRTLTIYLWHGFGLVAAAELVDEHLAPGPLRWGLALLVVVVVTAGCVVIFGPIEEWAAGRRAAPLPGARARALALVPRSIRQRPPAWRLVDLGDGATPRGGPAPPTDRRPTVGERRPVQVDPLRSWTGRGPWGRVRPRGRRLALRSGAALLAIGLVASALVVSPDGGSSAEPLSGQAVAARAGMLDATTTTSTSIPGASQIEGPTLEQEIQAWVERHPDVQTVGGLTTLKGAVVDRDGTVSVFSWSAGDVPIVTPADSGSPAVDGTPLVWWSMTKAATAVWLMRSVEAGAVALDDPLSRWMPEIPHAGEMTLEQLARHQSGIPGSLDDSLLSTEPIGVIQRYLDDPELAFAPGAGFDYSRLGYLLLATALERATGTTWRSAMEDLGARADVQLTFDEDVEPLDHVTDPDRHGYRGRTWSSGGIQSDPATLVRFFRWALTDGVSTASMESMSAFSGADGDWIYGIGLMPLCPCTREDSAVHTSRVGLDSVAGSFAVDLDSGAAVALYPDSWFDGDNGPRPEFYELESVLLDRLATP